MTYHWSAIITLLFAVAAAFSPAEAELPDCDYTNSLRVGSRNFEICSWTRVGSESVGLLQIAVVSGDGMIDIASYEIFGAISHVGVSDLDGDQYPEIHILIQSPDSTRYPELHFLELTNDELQERPLPELTSLQAHGYMGRDTITFEATRIVREFPIYKSNEAAAGPTGGKRRIIYKLSDTRFVLESRIDSDPDHPEDSL